MKEEKEEKIREANQQLVEPVKEKSNRYEHLQRVYKETMEKAKLLAEWSIETSYGILAHKN